MLATEGTLGFSGQSAQESMSSRLSESDSGGSHQCSPVASLHTQTQAHRDPPGGGCTKKGNKSDKLASCCDRGPEESGLKEKDFFTLTVSEAGSFIWGMRHNRIPWRSEHVAEWLTILQWPGREKEGSKGPGTKHIPSLRRALSVQLC